MAQYTDLKFSDGSPISIEWDMTPDLAFCMFSAKGLRDELSTIEDRVCYFFIDNYGDQPKLYLMERGSRFVNILAEINAPADLLEKCISDQGQTLNVKDNFPVDATLREWLLAEVIEIENSAVLLPITSEEENPEEMGDPLPQPGDVNSHCPRMKLPKEPKKLTDEQVEKLILKYGFSDQIFNKDAEFTNDFVASGHDFSLIDERTGLMWQRLGLDLCSIRNMKSQIEELNTKGFAGYHDWRMPTVDEALSLMENNVNMKGVYLQACFSKEQPFIFTSTKRKPTGYWFVDYKQGKAYWSSGTVPGGFCRLCRSVGW